MDECTLRAGTGDDAGVMSELFLAARRTAMPWLPELHSDYETREFVAQVVLGRLETTVAVVGGQVAGFAALDGDLLAHLYVDPRHQGHGVGSTLLDDVVRRRPDGVRLFVFARNEAARAFYAARGFTVAATGDGSGNEEGLPDVTMVWAPPRPRRDEPDHADDDKHQR